MSLVQDEWLGRVWGQEGKGPQGGEFEKSQGQEKAA